MKRARWYGPQRRRNAETIKKPQRHRDTEGVFKNILEQALCLRVSVACILSASASLRFVAAFGVTLCLGGARAEAQSAPFSIRGVADAGVRTFVAQDSFRAVLGQRSGPMFGGGVDVLAPRGIFGELHASRFQRTGERVFVFNGRIFPLGIPDTITVTAIEATGGIRIGRDWRVVPYAGGGVGWHRYKETSEGSTADEDANETFTGYHVLGGAEVRLWRWISAAGEAQWTFIPDALGQDPNGVSAAFGETDLGGASARVKIIVGR